VCICTRDRPSELAGVLASIAKSTYPVAHVVVSDDGCDPRTRTVCVDAPVDVHYAAGPRRGLAQNRNYGLGLIDEDLVLFLDDDCLMRPDFLSISTRCVTEHEVKAGVGRVIVTGVETNHGVIVHAAAQTFLGFQARPYRPDERMTSIVINATLFPRRLFDAHRFDDQIFYGYEEVELASRAALAGYRIVECPAAVNDHRPSQRSRTDYASTVVASRLYATFKRYAITERRWGRAVAFLVVAPLHAVGSAVRAGGIRATPDAMRAIVLAVRYFVAYRNAG
jgi:GT2 family glycosyltransferase